ncbi:copper homeostasis periplasmic binding protein CopC [Lichenihabitans sp. Uapishka_5]|uniref:copper homeostasis periplasmic binding protein CopC n=1 Tax=Lichenihabitans sp. Uapishka_5 TaxID=3037302 RepID=UPI0029E7D0A3|nr:copper homeostasis periplasmic binding protein CopC [Lichenihabitans sp. Uapishka_5]MDX7951550.1 copper homeostasis periplasmic binding protein CopC [Lichenihabitans sp. Uapishka_5]
MTASNHAAILLAAVLSLASAPAFAHAHLKAATPLPNGSVAAALELTLTFSEGVNPTFTGATLTGPGKAAVATGKAKLRAGDDTTLIVPVAAPLATGSYEVTWHALATDGHKTSGSYGFTVAP